MNQQKVAEALYEALENAGVRYDRAQAAALGNNLGRIISACIAAVHHQTPDRCSVCACLLPVQACGHSCCRDTP